MYEWRKMTKKQQENALEVRKQNSFPWHSPPHYWSENFLYHFTAACYEHQHIIGDSVERMACFEKQLIETLSKNNGVVLSWCVLPNHYHVLLKTTNLKRTVKDLGHLHGKSSYDWNNIEGKRGRQCWCHGMDRAIRTERHKYVTTNYIHHNPVHHKYVKQWQDWPFSSAIKHLEDIGHETAKKYWIKYPLLDYGKGWDDPN